MKSISSRMGMVAAMALALSYRSPDDDNGNQNGGGPAAEVVDATVAGTAAEDAKVIRTGAVQPELTPEQKAAQAEQIKANFNNTVDVVETAFHFRKQKDAETQIETKRNSVVIPLPIPSVEGIVAILEAGGKGLELLLESVRNTVTEQARDYINDNEDVTSENFPYDKMSWEAIANLPKAERRGGGIPKEVWEDFAKDYIATMPALINKPVSAVETAAKIFQVKFATCKTNKPVLTKLKEYLAIYINNTARGEEFAEAVTWLNNKIDNLLETGEQQLLAAL